MNWIYECLIRDNRQSVGITRTYNGRIACRDFRLYFLSLISDVNVLVQCAQSLLSHDISSHNIEKYVERATRCGDQMYIRIRDAMIDRIWFVAIDFQEIRGNCSSFGEAI